MSYNATKNGTKLGDAQKTGISVSADGYFGDLKKTETPSKRRRVGRLVFGRRRYRYAVESEARDIQARENANGVKKKKKKKKNDLFFQRQLH